MRGASLRLALLGGFKLSRGDGQAVEITGRKSRALLARLALAAPRAEGREQLAALLWGDRFDAQARQSLRQALASLRRALGGVAEAVLHSDADQIRLAPEAIEIDVHGFERAAAAGQAEAALALYRGDLLAGLSVRAEPFEAWLDRERIRLRNLACELGERWAQALAGEAGLPDAIATARQVVAFDPLREGAHRLLMELLAEAGEREAALVQYRTCERLLHRELQVGPSAEIRALYQALRDGKALPVRPTLVVDEGSQERFPAAPDKPSIAVLPFENMSDDDAQQYFSDGISEDIITDLSKVSGLFVIARNSSFVYRGPAQDLERVSRELGVRYLLEGSVRRAGKRVRITAQLIDGSSGGHVWAERYDRDLEDVFAVQAEVTAEIVSSLRVTLTHGERRRIGGGGTDSLEAYDCYLRAREQVWRLSRQSTVRARAMVEQAIALDPDFAAAHTMRSLIHSLAYINGWSADPEGELELGRVCGEQALAMDQSDPTAHVAMSLVHLWQRRLDAAIAEAERAIELDLNNAFAFSVLASALHYAGRSQEALPRIETAMRLDPHYPDLWLHFLGQIHFARGRYDEATAALERRLVRFPETDISRVLLAACYGHLGRHEAARARWDEVFQVNPDYALEQRLAILPYADPADVARIVEGLRRAALL